MEHLDDNGYPTDEFLEYVKNYDITKNGVHDLFDEIEGVWWGGEWRRSAGKNTLKKRIKRIGISTWGWSGNESIIYAMQSNYLLWAMYWAEHRKGGHYIFELPWDAEKNH